MELIVRKEFSNKIRNVAKIVDRSGVLQGTPIKFYTENGKVLIHATRETIAMIARSNGDEVEIVSEGEMFLSRQVVDSVLVFLNTLSSDDFIKIKSDETAVQLFNSSNIRIARLALSSAKSIWDFFALGDNVPSAVLDAEEFYKAIDFASHIRMRDDQFSAGFYFISENNLFEVACTDAAKLSSQTMDAVCNGEFKVFVNRELISIISFLRNEGKIKIKSDGRSFCIETRDYRVRTNVLLQAFPNHRRLLQEQRIRNATLNVDAIKDALSKIDTIIDNENFRVEFMLNKGGLVLNSKNKTLGEISLSVEADFDFTESSILFDCKYIQKLFASFNDKKVIMEFNPDSTVLFRGTKVQCLVMPLVLV